MSQHIAVEGIKEDGTGCTPISVDLEVITPDQKRKIGFRLEKDCNNDGTASWVIHFELDEASTSGNFQEAVELDIEINEGIRKQAA